MHTIGYIYFDNGNRIEAVHSVGDGGEAVRRSVEASTRQRFEFELRVYTFGPKPTRYDVQQFD